VELGKRVEGALKNKKDGEAGKFCDALKTAAIDYTLNNTWDEMFLNASSLVAKEERRI